LASHDEYFVMPASSPPFVDCPSVASLVVVALEEWTGRDTNSSRSGAEPNGLVHRLTRTELLASGRLVDVSLPAFVTGFRLPVAVSRAVWIECVQSHELCIELPGEQAGAIRLVTLLRAAERAARKNPCCAELLFSFALKRHGKPVKRMRLKMVRSAGDDCEPVITVLTRYED
jgi:hypothetical protein